MQSFKLHGESGNQIVDAPRHLLTLSNGFLLVSCDATTDNIDS